MFLSALTQTCHELKLTECADNYSAALTSILLTAKHINTMMWIGGMKDCPLDLAGQGQLLKQGTVRERSARGSGKKEKRRSSEKDFFCCLFLFQHCLVLCRTKDNIEEPNSPHLTYSGHVRYDTLVMLWMTFYVLFTLKHALEKDLWGNN